MADQKSITIRPCLKKVVVLGFSLTADGEGDEGGCDRSIKVPFMVSEVIVRQIITSTVAADSGALSDIRCPSFVNDTALGSFGGAKESSVTPGTTFTVGKMVDGVHTFTFSNILAADNAAKYSTYAGNVSIVLEFRG